MKRIFNSLSVKIGAIVILVEVITLSAMGVYYTTRFREQVERRVMLKIQIPGTLMSRGLLAFDAVADPDLMTHLVGKDFVDGMLINQNGDVVHALNPESVGKKCEQIPELQIHRFTSGLKEPIFERVRDTQHSYLVSVTPIVQEGQNDANLFVYIKSTTTLAEQEKYDIFIVFLLGSAASIAMTSIVILLGFQRVMNTRMTTTLKVIHQVGTGDFSSTIAPPIATDEIGQLQTGVNTMIAQLQEKMQSLSSEIDARRDVDLVLAEERNLLRTLIDHLPAQIFVKDLHHRYIIVNTETIRILGGSHAGDILGKTAADFYPAEVAEQFHQREDTILSTGEPILNQEISIIDPTTGMTTWWLSMNAPLNDAQGHISALIGFHWDITERKQFEDALQQSEQFVYSLLESLPQHIYSKDLQGHFIFANQSFCQIHGKTREEILGKTDYDLHPSELAEQYRQDDRTVIQTGHVVEAIEVHQFEEQTAYVHVLKTPLFDSNGKITGNLGVFWDITEKMQAENALRKSELLYRTTIDSLSEAIYVVDSDLRLTLYNSALMRWLNTDISEDDLIGRKIFDVFPFLPSSIQNEYQHMFTAQAPLMTEEHICIHNQECIIETTKIPVIEQEQISGIITVMRDVTKDRQAQHTILESNARYRSLVEYSPLGIISIEPTGAIVEANPMLLAIFGSPSVEAMSTINVFTNSAMIEAGITEDFRQCLESGGTVIAEHPYTSVWGKQVYLRYYLTPIRDAEEAISGVYAIIEDCTERKLVEDALKESEAEYRSLFKNMLSGLAYHKLVVNEQNQPVDFIFLEVNEAFERLTGLEKNIIGKRATDVIPGMKDTTPNLIRIYGNVALTGKETALEFFFEPFGVWFSVAAYSSEPGYFFALYDDITERKWAEEALRNMNEDLEQRVEARTNELQQTNQALQESLSTLEQTQKQLVQSEKMAALGGLVAGVAHEINTPVGVGVTAASYLEQQTSDIYALYQDNKMKRSELEHYLKIASESTVIILTNLHRAAEQIQSFKQVAVDQTSRDERTFRLKEYIDKILLSLHPTIKRTQHTISVECPDDLYIKSYPGAFSQIITNLVMNSLIHGFEHIEQGEITITARQTDEQGLVLLYRDNGRGISEANLSKIFEPFHTTKRGQGGSGLGLHIVYNLVTQRLGGRITCESTEGDGATFIIVMPPEACQ